MKKLMIALSAVAAAFAVHAEATTIAGENFNAATTVDDLSGWSGLGESSISSTAYSFSQAEAAGLPDLDRKAGAGNNLAIKTPLTAPAYLGFAETSMAGVYFDSLVKFTACDEDAEAVADAKVMVWTKELTNASGEVTGTNLMVTAGFFGEGDALQSKIYDCGPITGYGVIPDGNDWCRLTIKAKDTIISGGTVPGFVIFVNGTAVAIKGTGDALKIGLEGSRTLAALTKVDKIWEANHELFPSMVVSADVISAVGFAGQGAVDDIEVYSGAEPTTVDDRGQFALDPVPVLATVNGTECTSLDAINGAIADATSGAAVVLVDDVEGDLTFDNGSLDNTLELDKFTLNGGISVGSASNLRISGTGIVNGELSSDNTDAMVIIAGGKFLASANEYIKDLAEPADKENKELKLVGDYYELVEILENGTEAKPWLIGSVDDIANKLIAKGKGAAGKGVYFKLTNDIDASSVNPWTPIGNDNNKNTVSKAETKDTYMETAFQGNFDGCGYTISGVVLPRADYTGVFGSTYGANIKNLKVVCSGFDAAATAVADYGGAILAGVTVDTTIENCEVSGEATATKALAGIVGYGCSGTVVKGCVNKANLTTANEKVGGMIACAQKGSGEFGDVGVTVDGCTNEGNLTCSTSGKTFVGGLVSYADSKVTFKGANVVKGTLTQVGGSVSSIAAINGGSIVLDGATFTVPAGIKTVPNGKAVDGLNYATVEGDVATLVKASALAAGGTYKVMATGAKPDIVLAEGEAISFDQTLATIDVSGITAAEGCKIEATGVGQPIITYTAVKDAQPVNPGETKEYDSEEAAQEAADAFNDLSDEDKAKALAVPNVVENKPEYAALFAATANGKMVTYDLSEEAKTAIETELNASEATILNPTEGKATLTAKPGLWYGIKGVGDLSGIGEAEGQNWEQAKSTTVAVEVPAVVGDKAFFQPVCSAAAPKDE